MEFKFHSIQFKFDQIQIQLDSKKLHGMQIAAQAIETMLITFIVHDYDVEKEKNNLRKQKYEK
jgi:hypothetical protein